MSFDANAHVIQLKSKSGSSDYLPVQWRLVWVNEDYKDKHLQKLAITIIKSVIDLDREISKEIYAWNNETRRSEKTWKTDKGYAYYEMRVELVDQDGNVKIGEGSKSECAVDFPDYAEKAQTGAIGRALASVGYGTQFAPELNEEHRIVDAPVERASHDGTGNNPKAFTRPSTTHQDGRETDETVKPSIHTQNAQTGQKSPATEQQIASIRKLGQHLGKPELENPESITYLQAKEMISQLSTEYREKRKAS